MERRLTGPYLSPLAVSEFVNKKMKTDGWALGVGIGIHLIQIRSDSLIHVIFDFQVSGPSFVEWALAKRKPTFL